ncbi:CARDB domain-containing protein [Halosolutus gelatinilyticus]|uniref:CARDB domain-containing protein n=1 Tax=Halosolutus gelatinilyticus TaxID=2931975 RepID=UPI001FF23A94|nr:CARDB domain-containing protein [Halosolutus gelatinilyticus]
MKPRSTIDRFASHALSAALLSALVVLGLIIGAGGAAIDATAQDGDGANEYSIVQGEECYPIEPLGNGSQTVEEFYDYRTAETDPMAHTYSSHGTTHLQENDTSNLFLYEGSEGTSLVFLNDRLGGDSPGGAVTMQIDGLPEEGEWVLEDDDYNVRVDGPLDEFTHNGTSSRMTWVYKENRTDGAAFRGGLDDEFAIEIDPAFNDDADFQVYESELTKWQAISATDGGHERTALEMDEPIVLQSGGCGSISVTDLSVAETATTGESIAVEATVENDGHTEETAPVPITIDGESVDEQEVTLGPGETTTVESTVEFDEPGTYTVGAGNATVDVTVTASESGLDDVPGFGVTAAVAASALALLGLAIGIRTRRS